MKSFVDSFWDKVNIKGPNDCWEWKIANHDSYPTIYKNGRCYPAHRIAWILSGESIEHNKLILHKCDNKKCVNPNHLYMGSYSDNMTDRCDRFSGRIGTVGRFTKSDIDQIKEMFRSKIPRKIIMDRFGISRRYIYNLVNDECGINSI